ncbi:MAG: hypothetical protein ACI9TH_002731, partial [Kiritimatiellia bacterium]
DDDDDSGVARVYHLINGVWTQMGDDILGGDDDDQSGFAVALSSDGLRVAVGAPDREDDHHDHPFYGDNREEEDDEDDHGQVCVYEFRENAWHKVGREIRGDLGGDRAGHAVSLAGNGLRVAVGAPWNNNEHGLLSGKVRVYECHEGDENPPTLVCPDNRAIACNDSTAPSATGTATAADDTDPSPEVTFSDVFTPTCGSAGTLERTWTATDLSGNQATCVQVITIVDETPPVLSLPDHRQLTCGDGTLPEATGHATATDACSEHPTVTFSDSVEDGSCSGTMVITRTWTATDACGNTSSAPQIITITDTTAPAISCPASVELQCGASTAPSATGTATAEDHCDAAPVVTFTDHVTEGCGATRSIVRVWTATDACGNASSCEQLITISDTTAPAISCPTNVVVACGGSTAPSDTGIATAVDACDAAPVVTFTDHVTEGCGTTRSIVRVWTATDACGNASSCEQLIASSDTSAPVISCPANAVVECSGSTAPSATGVATAVDACDGAPVVTFTDHVTEGCGATRSIVRVWAATDACGNASSCEQLITVVDNTPPLAAVNDISIDLNEQGLATISAADINNESGDACGPVSLAIDRSEFSCADIGPNPVILTVTDACGNQSTATSIVTVVDAIAPQISCPDDVTVVCPGSTDPEATGTATVQDDCGAQLSYSDASNGCEITRTWSASDASGNSVSCTQIITVIDTTPPTAQCKNITVSLGPDGTVVVDPSELDNGSADDCGNVTLSLDRDTFGCTDQGVHPVVLTVTDACGNSAQCAANITVVDDLGPAIVCQDIEIVITKAAGGEYTLQASEVDGGTTDNCALDSLSVSPNLFTCAEHVDTVQIVTLTATDVNGNTSTCQAQVTVRSEAFITDQPDDIVIHEFKSHDFCIDYCGSTNGLTFQWYKDGEALSDQRAACISFECVRQADEGVYYVEVSNAYGPSVPCRSRDMSLVVTFGLLAPVYDLAVTNTEITVYGEAELDAQFGVFTTAGDVNGDRVDDLVVVWPNADGAGTRLNSGVLAVYFGAPHTEGVRDLAGIAGDIPDILVTGADAGDQLRYNSNVLVADVTGDGIGEIIVGAWLGFGENNLRRQAGEVAVIFGRDNWVPNASIDLASLDPSDGVMVYGANKADHLTEGGTLTTGDINGDGIQDLVMGAPIRAKAFVAYGRSIADWQLSGPIDLATETDVLLLGKNPAAVVTYAPALTTGDLDGDGFDEVILGVRLRQGPNGAYTHTGTVHVVRGQTTANMPAVVNVGTGEADLSIVGVDTGTQMEYLGALLASDLNNDGKAELIMGAPLADGPAGTKSDSGTIWIYNGRLASLWPALIDLRTASLDVRITGADAEDRIGLASSLAFGDVSGDGSNDLALGIPDADGPLNSRNSSGEVVVLSGGTLAGEHDLANSSDYDLIIYGGTNGDALTRDGSLALADVDCDGRADIIMGTHLGDGLKFGGGSEDGRVNAGEVLIVFGRKAWPTHFVDLDNPDRGADVTIIGAQSGDELTRGGVLGIGDLNGDHVPDIHFSASLSQGPFGLRPDSGEARVLYGHVPGPSLVITNLIVDFTQIDISGEGFAAGHPSSVWFEHGLTPALELGVVAATPTSIDGLDRVSIQGLVSGLVPNQTIYIQGVISNMCGVFRGPIVTARTLNHPAVAQDDTFESPSSTPFTIDPLSNDDYPLDTDGDTVSFQGFTNILGNINLSFTAPLVTVTPGAGFTGNAEFDYLITDGIEVSLGHVVLVDTIAPTVVPVGTITVEATSPAGADVHYGLTAQDAVDPNPSLVTTPPTGSTFPLGAGTVGVVASDAAGNVFTDTIDVFVVDTQAPTLELPTQLTVASLGPAAVSFTVTAPDLVDTNPQIAASPASGSTFPLGSTQVNVTATDASGNMATGSFTVLVTADIIVTQAPEDQTAYETASASFSVSATGPGALDYQWFGPAGAIAGAISPTLSLSCLTAADAGAYYVVVSNGSSSTTSPSATLATVAAPPPIDPTTDLGLAGAALATIYGNAAGDAFYGIALEAGDLNDDGYDDLVMSLPRADPLGRTDAGIAAIYFGNTTSQVRDFAALSATAPDVLIYGARAGDYLGRDHGLLIADLDHDGMEDLVLGVPFGDGPSNTRTSSGEACLLFGRTVWPAVIDLATEADVNIYGAGSADGLTLAGAMGSGDFNGDGWADLALGAPNADGPSNSRSGCGEAYVLLGRDRASWNATPDIDLAASGAASMQVIGAGNNDKLCGNRSLVVADLNNDGRDDLILGAGQADGPANGRANAGEVYVVTGQSVLPTLADLASGGAASIIYGADAGDKLGDGMAIATGDVNGDGYPDLVIGATLADGPANSRSAAGDAYLVLSASVLSPSVDLALGGAATTFHAPDANDNLTLGGAIALADVNGDGLADILLGASKGDGPANTRLGAGEVYLFWGRTSWPVVMDLTSGSDYTIYGAGSLDALGDAGGIRLADVSGDGRADLILGASGGDGPSNSRSGCGEVSIIFGSGSFPSNVNDLALASSADRVIFGADNGDKLSGNGALVTGDFNQDGILDLAVGATNADGPLNGRSGTGDAYIIAGQLGISGCTVTTAFAPASVAGSPLSMFAGPDTGTEAEPGIEPTLLDSPASDDIGNYTICLQAQAGYTYILQSSEDLVNWSPIISQTATTDGTLVLDDARTQNDAHGYYRVMIEK